MALDRAEDFLTALEPLRLPVLATDDPMPGEWIFRGQADATWPLIASALRPVPAASFKVGPGSLMTVSERIAMLGGEAPARWKVQAYLESCALHAFFDVADRSGLRIPDDSQALRRELEQVRNGWHSHSDVWEGWPPPAILSVLALGQHHGLPTRLLDWTRDARVGAYFAAQASIEREVANSRPRWLCVWAFNTLALGFAEDDHRAQAVRVRFVTAPPDSNPNLRAQCGLFSMLDAPGEAAGQPLEDVLMPAATFNQPYLLRFTLPTEQARQLLHLLAIHNVTAATVFPSFDGVVRSLYEERYWKK